MWGRKKGKDQVGRRSVGRQQSREVFSYYQNRVIPSDESVKATSERSQQIRNQFRRHHILSLVSLLIIVACFLYVLSLSPNPRVIIVNAQDQATQSLLRSEDAYSQKAEELLKSSLLNKSKVTLNTDALGRKLQEEFPEVAEAEVSLPLINRRPVIYLQITEPAFLVNHQNNVYAIDNQGRVIMKGDSTLPHSDLVRIDDQTTQEATIGKPFLPANQVGFLQEVKGQLVAKGITQISFTIPTLPNEVHMRMKDKPYYIKMTFSGDAKLQAGSLLAVKQKLENDKITPSQYIDVRVEDRAYYK